MRDVIVEALKAMTVPIIVLPGKGRQRTGPRTQWGPKRLRHKPFTPKAHVARERAAQETATDTSHAQSHSFPLARRAVHQRRRMDMYSPQELDAAREASEAAKQPKPESLLISYGATCLLNIGLRGDRAPKEERPQRLGR